MVTSKLGLNLPAGSDLVNVLTAIYNQMGSIDTNFDAVECTSSTRPSSPFNGQLIYETDTGDLLCRVASLSAWKVVARRDRGRGKVGIVTSTSASSNATKNTEIGPHLSITYTPVANRRYRIKWSVQLDVSGTPREFGDSKLRVRMSSGASVNTTHTEVYWIWADFGANDTSASESYDGFFHFVESATPPAQRTIGLFLARGGNNNGTLLFPAGILHTMMIEDVGAA